MGETRLVNLKKIIQDLMTKLFHQCNTCYGRDGTIASRSIDTERGSAALVLTGDRATVRKFLLTFAVTAAVTLFV